MGDKRVSETGWVWLIVGLAFALRFTGIDFGLPYTYHADEPIVLNRAIYYGLGDLNPHFFDIPPLVGYLLFGCYGIFFLIADTAGWINGVEGFQKLFLTDPTSFYLIARIVFGALMGTASVYALYRLVNRFFSHFEALAAAFLFAISFLHVRNSHFLYLDIPLVLVLILSFFPIFGLLNKPKRKHYVLFGLFHGLAVGTKYNGFFILVPFLTAHLIVCGRDWKKYISKDLILAGLCSIAAFIAVNPYSVLDFQAMRQGLINVHGFEGQTGPWHHLTYSLTGAVGIPVLAFSVIGILDGIFSKKNRKPKLVLMSYVFFYYFLLSHLSQSHARYVMPLEPFVILLAVNGLSALQREFPSRILTAVCLTALAVFPLLKSLLCNSLFVNEDIRTTAKKWIQRSLPENTKIAMDSPLFMPRLRQNIRQLEEKRKIALKDDTRERAKKYGALIRYAEESDEIRYELYFMYSSDKMKFLNANPVIAYDLVTLKQQGIEYVLALRIREDFQSEFYAELDRSAVKVRRFSPYRNISRDWPISKEPLTGAPFTFSELIRRRQNGQIIDLYRLP